MEILSDDDGCSVCTSCAVSRCPGLVAPDRGGDVAWSVLIVVAAASASRPVGSPSCNHSPLIPFLTTTTATGPPGCRAAEPFSTLALAHMFLIISRIRGSAVCSLQAGSCLACYENVSLRPETQQRSVGAMPAPGVTIPSHLTWLQSPGRPPTHLITGPQSTSHQQQVYRGQVIWSSHVIVCTLV